MNNYLKILLVIFMIFPVDSLLGQDVMDEGVEVDSIAKSHNTFGISMVSNIVSGGKYNVGFGTNLGLGINYAIRPKHLSLELSFGTQFIYSNLNQLFIVGKFDSVDNYLQHNYLANVISGNISIPSNLKFFYDKKRRFYFMLGTIFSVPILKNNIDAKYLKTHLSGTNIIMQEDQMISNEINLSHDKYILSLNTGIGITLNNVDFNIAFGINKMKQYANRNYFVGLNLIYRKITP